MNLRKRVRTVAPAEPAAGVVATLDDPRVGAVSAALARLRPQLVPDPDASDTGDYLAETEYGSTDAIVPPEPPAAPEPASIGARWAAALGRIQPPVTRPDLQPAPEPIAEAEPVAPPVVQTQPTIEPDTAPVPDVSTFSELQSVLAAVLDAEAEPSESAEIDAPVAELDIADAGIEEQPVDEEPAEAELVAVGVVDAPWAVAHDGTLLPRAPLHRSRLPHGLTGAFNRPRKRRRRRH